MKSPLFSIVIPTRERCETLNYSIKTIISQSFDDFELVVMDNKSSDNTKEIVDSFADPRIKYYQSPSRLSMRDNWELALSKVKGQYVSFIGDDDGLVPNALKLCSKIVDAFPKCQAIKWNEGHNYWWPNAIFEPNKNMLFISFENTFQLVKSKKKLIDFFNNPVGFNQLPTVYHGLVRKDLLWSIRDKKGQYFLDVGVDVYSSIINAYFTDEYLYSLYPLSIKGVSGKSTGTSYLFRGEKGKEIRQAFAEEYGDDKWVQKISKEIKEKFDDTRCNNVQLYIVDCMMFAKETFFPDDQRFVLNKHNALNSMLYTLRFDPDGYEESLEEITHAAQQWEIPLSELKIPPKVQLSRPKPGPQYSEDGRLVNLVVDGDLATISNVYDASNLIGAMVPTEIRSTS